MKKDGETEFQALGSRGGFSLALRDPGSTLGGGMTAMWKSPWTQRFALTAFAAALYLGVAAHWWMPRGL